MGVKFFGQFLIEQGEIDAGQLREALDYMRARNKPLGQIAVEAGYLSRRDADGINAAQRHIDRPFGELACASGLLGVAQFEEVIATQTFDHMQIGEALIELGSLEADRLAGQLDRFKADQAPYEVDVRDLPGEIHGNSIAPIVLDLLPKFHLRVARLPLKTGFGQPLSKLPSFAYNVGVRIEGPASLQVTLLADEHFARALAAATAYLDEADLDRDLTVDGLGEFLNVLCGNVVAVLERDGTAFRLGPPRLDREFRRGVAFELAAGDGCAALVLAAC